MLSAYSPSLFSRQKQTPYYFPKNTYFKNASLDELEEYLSAQIVPLYELDELKERLNNLREENQTNTNGNEKNDDCKQDQFSKIDAILNLLETEIENKHSQNSHYNDLRINPIKNDIRSGGTSFFDTRHPQFNRDIALHILSHLSFEDILPLQAVSKTFKTFIDNLFIARNYIICGDICAIRTTEFLNFEATITSNKKHLTIGDIRTLRDGLKKNPSHLADIELMAGKYSKKISSVKNRKLWVDTANSLLNCAGSKKITAFLVMLLFFISMYPAVKLETWLFPSNQTHPNNNDNFFINPDSAIAILLTCALDTAFVVCMLIPFAIFSLLYKKYNECTSSSHAKNIFGLYNENENYPRITDISDNEDNTQYLLEDVTIDYSNEIINFTSNKK